MRKEFVTKEPLFLYLHIPFCLRACPYCNFNFRLLKNFSSEFLETYVESLLVDWQAFLSETTDKPQLETIYFGGGTPSLIPPHLIEKIMLRLREYCVPDVEITLEANPENLVGKAGQQLVRSLRTIGVNRLSLGAQSFVAAHLHFLGRNHTGKDIREAVDHARQANFSNISMDVIGFLPNEKSEDVLWNLQEMIKCVPNHVSFYGLTIEEKTPFFQKQKEGALTLLPDEQSAQHYEAMVRCLENAGFEQYEISNFSKPGFRSRHNQCYWTYRPYLGLGAGAHSFFRTNGRHLRSTNVAGPQDYVRKVLESPSGVAEMEVVDGRLAMAEFVFTGLRRREGIVARDFYQAFQEDLLTVYAREIAKFIDCKLLSWSDSDGLGRLSLTQKGILLSDTVFAEFT